VPHPEMPPKKGGGGTKVRDRSRDLNKARQSTPVIIGPQSIKYPTTQPTTTSAKQSKFSIAPLILEGVKLNKLQLNDILKQHLQEIRISDIQLNRAGIFTLYAADVSSFNRLLNDFTSILVANGQSTAKIYVPRSIQRIKDTEKVAFVKRVDLEIPENRITDALKDVGLKVENVIRLMTRERNNPTTTIKITFNDPDNRNTFVHTGLQVDSMHFNAEPATQNVKPVQCFICLKYNHVAKYCKTKQQACSRCGDNHQLDKCSCPADVLKCCNCQGNHLATSQECPQYQEQEKRMKSLVNQYSSTRKPTTVAPAIHCLDQFPLLPNSQHQQIGSLQNGIIEELINVLTSKMEKIIEETSIRLFKTLNKKIQKIEKYLSSLEIASTKDTDDSDSDDDNETQIITNKKNEKQQQKDTTKQIKNPPTTTNNTTTKQPSKPKATTKTTTKRIRSPNTSMESLTTDIKDLKTNNNVD